MASEEPERCPPLMTTPMATDSRAASAPAPANLACITSGRHEVLTSNSVTLPQETMDSETGSSSAAIRSATQAIPGNVFIDQAPTVKTEPCTLDSTLDTVSPASAVDTVVDQDFEQTKRESTENIAETMAAEDSEDESMAIKRLERKQITLENIRRIAESRDLPKLKAAVEAGRELLHNLRGPIADSKQQCLLDAIDKLKSKSTKTRTVVSVAGATGAGKSSLINAVLDETKLLPTNGMRACTAVITEISYNEIDDPEQLYRAEIEFISLEDWNSELMALFSDLIDGNQLDPSYRDPNTEAGVAYAKMRAVYPDLGHDQLVKSHPEDLANRPSVQEVLGKTKKLAFSTSRDLYSALKVYLDSKDKQTRRESKGAAAFWPLIKVIRIYCKAKCLSNGVVIVDLPGIHDANAARSAVAHRYMAECTAVWLASPIKRAVDDKAAKDLLGRSSRTQLKMDGMYSNVTFICTCTDIFEISETLETLDEDGNIQQCLEHERILEEDIQNQDGEILRLKKRYDVLDGDINDIEHNINMWKELERRHQRGEIVHLPVARPASRGAKRRRRARIMRSDGDEHLESSDQKTLTAAEISTMIQELEERYDSKLAEQEEIEGQQDVAQKDLAFLQEKKVTVSSQAPKMCVKRRNEYCTAAIKVDFATGIREIDEEAGEQDDQTYDPSVKKRDYDEVASLLPVFCISSKAYQQLRSTRDQRETMVEGFTCAEDTGLPQLQEHTLKLTDNGHITSCKSFINELCQLLGTLKIYAGSSDLELAANQLSEEDRTYEVKQLNAKINNLKKDFTEEIFALKQNLMKLIRQGPNVKGSGATKYALSLIDDIVISWGLPQTKKSGTRSGLGLAFATYRATCKRDGAKTANAKSRDFNEQILEPYLTKISTSWEETFSTSVPKTMDMFVSLLIESLTQFHAQMLLRPELVKCREASLRILEQQIQDHGATIRDAVENVKTSIQGEQRHCSRMFYPEIKRELKSAYALAGAEKGAGCFKRMKDIMLAHVKNKKQVIYRRAYTRVQKCLEKGFAEIEKELGEHVHEVCDTMERNYKIVISSSDKIEAGAVAREHILKMLMDIDSTFKLIADMQTMEVCEGTHSDPAASNDVAAAMVTPDAADAAVPAAMN